MMRAWPKLAILLYFLLHETVYPASMVIQALLTHTEDLEALKS